MHDLCDHCAFFPGHTTGQTQETALRIHHLEECILTRHPEYKKGGNMRRDKYELEARGLIIVNLNRGSHK